MLRFKIPALTTATLSLLSLFALIFPGLLNAQLINDPFAPFDAIAPGQPVSALHDYVCTTLYTYDYWNNNQSFCQIHAVGGPINSITVISQDNYISSLWFHITGLRMADVAHRWGRPDKVHLGKRYYIARWENGIYATAITSGWFTLNSPVNILYVTRTPEPT